MENPEYHPETQGIVKIDVVPNNNVIVTRNAPVSCEQWTVSQLSELLRANTFDSFPADIREVESQFAEIFTRLSPRGPSSIQQSPSGLANIHKVILTGLRFSKSEERESFPLPISIPLPNLELLVLSGDLRAMEIALLALRTEGRVSDLEITALERHHECRVVARWEDKHRPVLEIVTSWSASVSAVTDSEHEKHPLFFHYEDSEAGQNTECLMWNQSEAGSVTREPCASDGDNACLGNPDDRKTPFAKHLDVILGSFLPGSKDCVSLQAMHPYFENADNMVPLVHALRRVSKVEVPIQRCGPLYGLLQSLRVSTPELFPRLHTLSLTVVDGRNMSADLVAQHIANTLLRRKKKGRAITTLALSEGEFPATSWENRYYGPTWVQKLKEMMRK
ncbi:hypothetical protein FA95DRAFT_1612417 [Auriscalpium vulgare]|uniref:Uncharacterized protein n=1 Tax=Auriscalpium vulgare TaxID=40419 RepID=A0ACB8R778_9AGAM|nr:hypothetical protein FA95DRAFT_1612417 [Auriscalpium vulgare]